MATRKKRTTNQPFNPLVLIVVGGALVLLVAVALLMQSFGGTPQLAVDQELIDFGPVPVGEMVTASFTLTNTGSGPLTFTSNPRVEAVKGC